MDRLSCMEVFVSVAETLNFSVAADRLEISNSAVTKKLRWLEDQLKVRLFNRTTRKVALTDVGQTYYEHCVRLLADVEEAESAVSDINQDLTGSIRIACSESFGRLHLISAAKSFSKQWPNVEISLDLRDNYVDIVQGNFDLVVRGAQALPDSRLISAKLAPNQRVVCASHDYIKSHGQPTKPEDLEHHRCIINNSRQEFLEWEFSKDGQALSIRPRGNLKLNSTSAIETAAIEGMGIVRLPTYIVGERLRDGKLVQLMKDYTIPENSLYLVYPEKRFMSSKVKLFSEHLKSIVGKPPYWDRFDADTNELG